VQESTKARVLNILNDRSPSTVLDAPCGEGWLSERLAYRPDRLDGIDLYTSPRGSYTSVEHEDLDYGLPRDLPKYDCIVSCEGLEHFRNPDLFLKTAREHLLPDGFLLLTTPNVWYPAARLQYLMRGFHPGFPCLAGKIQRGTHMHLQPWSYPQLYLFLQLNGFDRITLHEQPMSRPKHLLERAVALPQRIYCRRRLREAITGEERDFWRTVMSPPSLYGRNLLVVAER